MWDCPDFLELPERDHKPRRRGLTHVLDKSMTTAALEAQAEQRLVTAARALAVSGSRASA